MDVNTEDLRLLIAILDRGSLAAGARALGLDASAATRRIQRLEADFGAPLLHRHTRALRPTASGERLAATARVILADLDALSPEENAAPSGIVRVSAPVLLGHRLGPPLIAALRATHPRLVVSLHLDNARVDLLRDGFDLALRTGPLDPGALVAKRLGSAAIGLYAAIGTVDPGPDGWARLPWVTPAPGEVAFDADGPGGVRRIGPVEAVAHVGDRGAAARVIAAGVGVGLLPAFLGDHEPGLVRLGPEHTFGSALISAVYLPTSRGDARVRAVVDAAAAWVEGALGARGRATPAPALDARAAGQR